MSVTYNSIVYYKYETLEIHLQFYINFTNLQYKFLLQLNLKPYIFDNKPHMFLKYFRFNLQKCKYQTQIT